MSALTDLLQAQRRPDHEAQRFTEEFAAALNHASDDGEQIDATATAGVIRAAYELTNERIASENTPRPVEARPHGSHSGELRGDGSAAEEITDEEQPDQHSLAADPAAIHRLTMDVSEPVTPADAAHTPHDESEPPQPVADGVAADSVGSFDTESGDSPGVAGPTEAADRDEAFGVDGDAFDESEGRASDEEPDDLPASLSESAGPETGDDTGLAGHGDIPEADDMDVSQDVPYPETEPLPDAVPAAPSALDAYAAASDPWGDQEEIGSYESGRPQGEQNGSESHTADPDAAEMDAGEVEPTATSTAPPESIEDPDPVPESGFRERAIDAGRKTVDWIKRNRKQTLAYGAVFGAVVLAIGGLFSSASYHRGKPPLPANTIATPNVPDDNAEKTPQEKTLIPSMVSSSCGDDVDAVGPFSADKKRAWVCARKDGLDLNVLKIAFDNPVVITKICVTPGWDYIAPDGRDEWVRHRIAASVTWRMGGQIIPQNLTPTRTGVCKEFPSVITTGMSMTITASQRPQVGEGSKRKGGISSEEDDENRVDADTAISSVIIEGHPLNPSAPAGN